MPELGEAEVVHPRRVAQPRRKVRVLTSEIAALPGRVPMRHQIGLGDVMRPLGERMQRWKSGTGSRAEFFIAPSF